eukprot:GFYU01014192.1.p1 GENE.GFYU01014192.1~~GFYU01014192.1.p1  ORF type:complete len:156 (-),score=65.02 GFYU01014192.1:264-704(-)
MAPFYELTVLASARVSNTRLLEVVKKCTNKIVNSGGVVRNVSGEGEVWLAYEIRKDQVSHQSAKRFQMLFDCHPTVLKEVEHNLRVNDSILRFMSLKQKEFPALKTQRKIEAEKRRALSVAEMARMKLEKDHLFSPNRDTWDFSEF